MVCLNRSFVFLDGLYCTGICCYLVFDLKTIKFKGSLKIFFYLKKQIPKQDQKIQKCLLPEAETKYLLHIAKEFSIF